MKQKVLFWSCCLGLMTALQLPAQVVISQVYGGGGNSGATLRNDFIELFNPGTVAVDLTGWSVQYASASGTAWQVTTLSGTIQPGQYFLVQEAAGTGGTVSLPTPDATGSIAMSGTSGKVALVNSVTALSGACPAAADLVGYGTANCFEGTGATPALSNTVAAIRTNQGCTDSNNNTSDFATGTPSPRNTSSAIQVCQSTGAVIATSVPELNFGEVTMGTATVKPYEVTGTNLTETIAVTSENPAFALSVDSVNFSTGVSLPAAGGKVFVRFTAAASGEVASNLTHTSSTTQKELPVKGFGYNAGDNVLTISLARQKAAGSKVTVAGRVTAANQLGSPSFVQDTTGGIAVFSFPFSNAVQLGDSVVVTGSITAFNNQVQLGGAVTFTRIDVPVQPVTPKTITLDQLAANEGLLVTVQSVELVNKNFVFYPESTEKITAGGTTADLRIDGDTDLPGLLKPQGTVNLTGVVGRFRTNAQLLPRFRADVPGSMEPSNPSDSISKDQTFDVVTWNLEFFGAEKEDYQGEEYGPENEALQLQNVRNVLDSLNADIVAVEEVSDTTYFTQLISQLPGYGAVLSNRYSYSFQGPDNTFPPQRVGFIYKTSTVQNVKTQVLLEKLYDEARNGNAALLPNYPTGDPSSFWSSGRLPLMLTADATINGITKKVRLIVVHAKSGATEADRRRREYDAQVLKDTLDTYYANDRVMLLGDYNDDVDVSIAGGAATSYQSFVSDTAGYQVLTKTLSAAGFRSTVGFNDMIDHIAISNELAREYLPGSVNVITPFRLIRNYANTTSDHLPVTARFAFRWANIRFAASADTIREGSGAYKVVLNLSSPAETTQTLTVTINDREAQYGLPGKGDYVTNPDGSPGSFNLTVPAGVTSVSFTVTPDKNAARQKEGQLITFTATNPSDGVTIGQPASFDLTILDKKKPKGPYFAVWPNPTSGWINLICNFPAVDANNIQATLRTHSGEILYSGTGTLTFLSRQISQQLHKARRGMYLIGLKASGETVQLRVLKW